MASELFIAVRIAFVIVTTVLFFVILAACYRFKSRRMLLITVGFGLFFVHGLLTAPEIFSDNWDITFSEGWHLLADVAGLVFIMLGTLQDVIFKKKQE